MRGWEKSYLLSRVEPLLLLFEVVPWSSGSNRMLDERISLCSQPAIWNCMREDAMALVIR